MQMKEWKCAKPVGPSPVWFSVPSVVVSIVVSSSQLVLNTEPK